MQPNRERIRAWVEALRSGLYEQGPGYLRRSNQYCCLGVLCDLHDPLRWRPCSTGTGVPDSFAYEKGGTSLPSSEVLEWVGIEPVPDINGYKLMDIAVGPARDRLSFLNDSRVPFCEIADRIEKEYLTDAA